MRRGLEIRRRHGQDIPERGAVRRLPCHAEKLKRRDAVVIGTPDHMHAPITLAALRAGKHVYVEKPMAHSIEEARVMTRVAKETGLVTQMGNNGHAGEGLRLTREWIQAGAIGQVKEVHCWSDRPGKWWTQDRERPAETPPVPAELNWNLWLGAAPERPYHPCYHPVAWRGWFDFGTGALGDMAIHNLDPAFYALDLDAPVAAESQSSPLKKESYPAWQIITFEFAAKASRPALKMLWYDGGKMPPVPEDLGEGMDLVDNGIYFLGEKGTMLCGGWSGPPRLFPAKRRSEFQLPPKAIARSPGHRDEWVQACKAKSPTPPRRASRIPALTPRPCSSATSPPGCRHALNGTPQPCGRRTSPRPTPSSASITAPGLGYSRRGRMSSLMGLCSKAQGWRGANPG